MNYVNETSFLTTLLEKKKKSCIFVWLGKGNRIAVLYLYSILIFTLSISIVINLFPVISITNQDQCFVERKSSTLRYTMRKNLECSSLQNFQGCMTRPLKQSATTGNSEFSINLILHLQIVPEKINNLVM